LEFTRVVMDILVKNLDTGYLTTNGENNLTLTVKRKRCYQKMIEMSVKCYLQENVSDAKDLMVIVEYFDRQPWGNKSEALIEQICEIFENGCLLTLLAPMPVKFLKAVCKRMRIEYPKGQISSKVLADFIIFGTHSVDEVSEEEKPDLDLSPKCPDRISEKCSRSDLIHYFTINDLQKFLIDHEMISTGKKVQLVNRILDYYVDKDETFNRFNPEKRREKKRVLTEQKRETEIRRKQREEEKRLEREAKRKEKMSQDIDEDSDDKKSSRNGKDKFNDESSFEDSLNEEDTQDNKENEEDEAPIKRRTSVAKGRQTGNKRNSDKRKLEGLTNQMSRTKVSNRDETDNM